MSNDKYVNSPHVLIYRMTSSEYLRHILLSLRKTTKHPSMMPNSCSLSYFEHTVAQVSVFPYVYSKDTRYIIIPFKNATCFSANTVGVN